MTFDAAAAKALIEAVKSHAQTLGVFDRVTIHAPENAPGSGLSCWFTLGDVVPVQSSGLGAVSIEVTLTAHIVTSMLQKPMGAVEWNMLGAVSLLMNAYAGDFNLGGLVRDVNIFAGLKADLGYLDFQEKSFRIAEITIPLVVNDAWVEAP